MGRILRIEFPGALYHVIARGNRQSSIYLDNDDRYRFLGILCETAEDLNLVIHSYCLMSNHYHLLAETPMGNISSCMHLQNSRYAKYFNRKYDRTGHLFQGRYKAILVQKENYLLELCRYIELNPIRASLVDDPSEYHWSSYRSIIGVAGRPYAFLSNNWILTHFDEDTAIAREKYIRFVHEGIDAGSPMDLVRADLVLGDNEFIKSLKDKTDVNLEMIENSKAQRLLFRKDLSEVLSVRKCINKEIRNKLILEAHNEYGYTFEEISDHLGLHRSTIGRIVKSG